MKSFTSILLLLLGIAAPAGAAPGAMPAPPTGEEPGVNERLGEVVPADIALYDSAGERVLLGALIKRPTILLPAYYGCTDICPAAISDLSGLLGRLSSVPGADYSVITVSFDENDTPYSALRKKRDYIKAIGRPFPEEGWRFLTGDKENISRLMRSLGWGLRRADDKGFSHPSALVVLSPERKIIRYIYGSGYMTAEVEMAFSEARAGTPAPTIPKALLFCFTYDPAGKRYVFDFLKVSGLGVLASAAGFLIYLTKKKRD
jgi:protein SCO1/2